MADEDAEPTASSAAAEASRVENQEDDEALEDFALSSDGDISGAEDGGGGKMRLDKAMMNELLLVCSNLGMLRVVNEGEPSVFMRGEDCGDWIHDLQRAIRRDHAKHKLIAKQLGKWKILQKKLLPLLVNHQHDWSLVFSILKVLVMLTMKPTQDSTNIAEQLRYLREYKHAFLTQEIIPILMSILVDPLSRKGSARTAQDYLIMELVLTLFRNLLAIPNEDSRFVTSTTSYMSHLQEDLVCSLHQESAYDMILLFAQDIDSAETREWNLLVMEMMDLTLNCSTPKAIVAFTKQQLLTTQTPLHTATQENFDTPPSLAPRPVAHISGEDSLLGKLSKEKKRSHITSQRHSNFGGVMTMVGPTGRTTLLANFSKANDDQVPQAVKKPVMRKRGKRGTGTQVTDINEVFGTKTKVTEADEPTMLVLKEICDTIIAKSYFQLTNSLKTEFRRGSSKLVSTDRLQYFRLVWFLTTYHRLKLQMLKSMYRQQCKVYERAKIQLEHALDLDSTPPTPPEKPAYDEKAVLSTLDMFSFNFVLQSIETYASAKNYHGMSVSVKLLSEMMAYISELALSDDPRYQRIADSLQHKILYERDFLDRLPVLLKTWSPGIFPQDYAVDVITLTHLVFKILDAQGNVKVLSRRKAHLNSKKTKQRDQDDGEDGSEGEDEEETERQAQLMLELQRKEADFDVRRYFVSIVSTDTIRMYCHILSSYRDNSPKVNHYIHSFLYRVKHFAIQQGEKWTMQPLLYNIHVLLLFNRMLQDAHIQRLQEFKGFLHFVRGVIRDFFALGEKNHLLFVESLLRQSYPSKSCLLLQKMYEPIDSTSKSRAEAVALGRQKEIETINEIRRKKIAMDAEELEGETEFQFTLEPSDFQSSTLVANGGPNEAHDHGEAEFGDDGSETEASRPASSAVAFAKKKPTVTNHKKSQAQADRAKNWTKIEDRYLEKVYRKFRHLPSVYEVISYEDMFQDRDRTPEQIERRVKYLKLHRKTHDSSDEDEIKDENKAKEENSDEEMSRLKSAMDVDFDNAIEDPRQEPRRRRLRRGVARHADSSSESDDDIFGLSKPQRDNNTSKMLENERMADLPVVSAKVEEIMVQESEALDSNTTEIDVSVEQEIPTKSLSGNLKDAEVSQELAERVEDTEVLDDLAERLDDTEVLEQAFEGVANTEVIEEPYENTQILPEVDAPTDSSPTEPSTEPEEATTSGLPANPLKRSRENGKEEQDDDVQIGSDSPLKKIHRAAVDDEPEEML